MRLSRSKSLIGFLLSTLAPLLVACAGDPTITDRNRADLGVVVLPPGVDAEALNEAGGNPCPENEPKLGDRCPPGFSEGNSCTYAVDTCTSPDGVTYVDYLTYCCLQTLWASCGGMSACDAFDAAVADARRGPDAGAVDAPFSADASADGTLTQDAGAGDAGQTDSSSDAGPTD
jgi:hypothetical protein